MATPSEGFTGLLNTNLIAHFNFDDNLNDMTGNQHYITGTGGVFTADSKNVGKRLYFTGNSTYSCIDTSDLFANEISISVFLTCGSYQGETEFLYYGAGATTDGFQIFQIGQGQFRVYCKDRFINLPLMTAGQEYNIIFTFKDGTFRVYMDNVFINSISGITLTYSGIISLGNYNSGYNSYAAIDELRIYNVEIGANIREEIFQMGTSYMKDTTGTPEGGIDGTLAPNLIAHFGFGNTFKSTIGFLNLTLYGCTLVTDFNGQPNSAVQLEHNNAYIFTEDINEVAISSSIWFNYDGSPRNLFTLDGEQYQTITLTDHDTLSYNNVEIPCNRGWNCLILSNDSIYIKPQGHGSESVHPSTFKTSGFASCKLGVEYDGDYDAKYDEWRIYRNGLKTKQRNQIYDMDIVYPKKNYPPYIKPFKTTFIDTLSITIYSKLPEYTTYYTIDGSTPTTSSPHFTGTSKVITINQTTTIKTFSALNGFLDSEIVEITYNKIASDLIPRKIQLPKNEDNVQFINRTVTNICIIPNNREIRINNTKITGYHDIIGIEQIDENIFALNNKNELEKINLVYNKTRSFPLMRKYRDTTPFTNIKEFQLYNNTNAWEVNYNMKKFIPCVFIYNKINGKLIYVNKVKEFLLIPTVNLFLTVEDNYTEAYENAILSNLSVEDNLDIVLKFIGFADFIKKENNFYYGYNLENNYDNELYYIYSNNVTTKNLKLTINNHIELINKDNIEIKESMFNNKDSIDKSYNIVTLDSNLYLTKLISQTQNILKNNLYKSGSYTYLSQNYSALIEHKISYLRTLPTFLSESEKNYVYGIDIYSNQAKQIVLRIPKLSTQIDYNNFLLDIKEYQTPGQVDDSTNIVINYLTKNNELISNFPTIEMNQQNTSDFNKIADSLYYVSDYYDTTLINIENLSITENKTIFNFGRHLKLSKKEKLDFGGDISFTESFFYRNAILLLQNTTFTFVRQIKTDGVTFNEFYYDCVLSEDKDFKENNITNELSYKIKYSSCKKAGEEITFIENGV